MPMRCDSAVTQSVDPLKTLSGQQRESYTKIMNAVQAIEQAIADGADPDDLRSLTGELVTTSRVAIELGVPKDFILELHERATKSLCL